MKRKLYAHVAIALGLLTAPALAETVKLHGTLSSGAEVPPHSTAGAGTCDATLDTATHTLNYTITYSGLSGPATMAHFHGPAAVGENAKPLVTFKSADSPIKGTETLTEAQQADLLAGKWYANVHTATNPGGEIRCQLQKS